MTNQTLMPRQLFIGDFAPLVGHAFVAQCDPQPVEIRLVEAEPLRADSAPDSKARAPFVLIFHSSPAALLTAGVYQLQSGRFGPQAIYLERTAPPVKAAIEGYYYQAVFN